MSDALSATFYLFGKWISYVFHDMQFTYSGLTTITASFGWLIIAAAVISMIVASILNIPRTLPSEAFYSRSGRIIRDKRRTYYRKRVNKAVNQYMRSRG